MFEKIVNNYKNIKKKMLIKKSSSLVEELYIEKKLLVKA
jgi:hypothetical protein